MAGGKILKERGIVKVVGGTVTETKKNCSRRQTNFKPESIKIRGFKYHVSCNRSVDVTVGTNTPHGTELRVKIVVGDVERIRGNIIGNLGFGEK